MSSSSPPDSTDFCEPAPSAARELFGAQFHLAEQFAALLCEEGTEWGLIGPRERPRIWSRHVAHCALLSELIAPDREVLDVGSGAGLPGLPLAIARPDLTVTLLEPLARRIRFLEFAVQRLSLPNVTVVRAKAHLHTVLTDVVTARAVAPLERLAAWTVPLLRFGGELLAIRGASAHDELTAARAALTTVGVENSAVRTVEHPGLDPLIVVRAVRVSRETSQRRRR